jgi:VanZ family protein
MDGITAPTLQRPSRALWLSWLLAVALWTSGLLTTLPVRVKDAVLPPEAGYHAAKALHVSAYAVLAGTAAWLIPGSRLRFLPILFLSLHGFGTEFLQTFVEGRHGCLEDVAIDHIGIALGLLLTGWKWLSVRL